MRIDRLDLSRYGKFTDVTIDLPVSKRDFHLIVGSNEAGKSTFRDAITDLLFGIEMRSAYDFLHPKAELRLGAAISHSGSILDFQRVKKAKSLLDAQGTVISEQALTSFLGNADRGFFDHMFGLNHDRLVSGGNEILKASNDVGRILFQSATGIASLGSVRDALEEEADKLWARRKSGDRAYYAAADELAAAESALKLATVKTRDWSDARGSVDKIERELTELKETFHTLETDRVRLERIRRVAPSVHAFTGSSHELATLGEVANLPQDATAALTLAETGIATAASQQKLARELAEEARTALERISIDEAALRNAEAIVALAERAQQTRFHDRDIGKRQIELEGHWQGVTNAVRQLGWPVADEATIETSLPPLPVRSTIANLVKRHGVIEQLLASAAESEQAKIREISGITTQLEGLAQINASPELRAALDTALGLGNLEATRKHEISKAAKTKRDLHSAEARLGLWRLDSSELSKLVLPSVETVRQLRIDFDRLNSERLSLSARKADLIVEIGELELEISQFRNSRQAVTLDDLSTARNERDSAWTAIKSGETPIAEGSADYESHILNADGLSDRRHDKAQEAAELQAKIDELSRRRFQLQETDKRLSATDSEIVAVQQAWATHATALGFPNMPLLAYEEWRLAHAEVITAVEAVKQAESDSEQLESSIYTARIRLANVLTAVAQPAVNEDGIDVLIEAAKVLVEEATATKARREELQRQSDNSKETLATLSDKLTQAQKAHNEWQTSWDNILTKAGLSADTDIGAAEGALALFESIDKGLVTIQEIRRARIETMRKDLDDFGREALTLVQAMAPELNGRGSNDIAVELSNRLASARDDRKEADRLTVEFRRFDSQITEAQQSIDAAEASIAPLMSISSSTTRDALRAAIARSDTHRTLIATIEEARRAAEASGDGLNLAQLTIEIESADIPQIAVRLGEIASELETARNHQAELAAELATANAALGKIAGKDDAARAESARQDALAKMADAVERFIKVYTAGRLLRWAIDRYRETKQGPMLAQASEIFCRLTLGSFAKLVVDFECDPPTLDGMRPDGKTVGIAGMSDGTRDQLYLALRLAALEMHISQAHALPFIADDLFINYDDDRARAGIEALAKLSETTQVIFLTHHEHLVPAVKAVFGEAASIVELKSH